MKRMYRHKNVVINDLTFYSPIVLWGAHQCKKCGKKCNLFYKKSRVKSHPALLHWREKESAYLSTNLSFYKLLGAASGRLVGSSSLERKIWDWDTSTLFFISVVMLNVSQVKPHIISLFFYFWAQCREGGGSGTTCTTTRSSRTYLHKYMDYAGLTITYILIDDKDISISRAWSLNICTQADTFHKSHWYNLQNALRICCKNYQSYYPFIKKIQNSSSTKSMVIYLSKRHRFSFSAK